MQLEEATVAARSFMDATLERPEGLVLTRAELRPAGWMFFYSSTAFVETRDWHHALGGDLPILVGADGTVAHVPIDEIASCGTPIHGGAP